MLDLGGGGGGEAIEAAIVKSQFSSCFVDCIVMLGTCLVFADI